MATQPLASGHAPGAPRWGIKGLRERAIFDKLEKRAEKWEESDWMMMMMMVDN